MKRFLTSPVFRHFGKLVILLGLIGLGIDSCIEPFSPPEVSDSGDYLVVDGFLNVSGDTSIVKLGRTQNINNDSVPYKESGAIVTVEAENGQQYLFSETETGVYALPPEAFDLSSKYRIHIRKSSGSQYVSDYVTVSNTPPIDSISYRFDRGRDAMIVYANTHDATGATRFYRWKYEETYQYRAAHYSSIVRNADRSDFLARNEDINLCWKTQESGDIKLGSTIKLSQDIVKELPVNVIDASSNKLYFGYSILVKQYGLSREAFEYWTQLAKTTQGTGSLFDPLPNQVTGNIKNEANNKELIFGYFSAAVEQRQRIFIRDRYGRYPTCQAPDSITRKDALESEAFLLGFYTTPTKSGILASSEYCGDCRVQGGTIKKPSFWK
ncbi:DUF4249 domain-containing protein [Dyadobacter luticola]|uniref:DUF4249 domain-containing protein n=1 Tax=Dyadobacter luticola TaxID=1979387 RepID=A0A5R9KWH8_9BACT|nr:DUF4249 domain-containing protein [Dyadobacter luticola]TLV00604.1 DUF4249 domain-containing protein [Dyadobacter luticola]